MPVNQKYYYQDEDIEALSHSTDPRIIWAPAVPMDQIGLLSDSFQGLKEGQRLLLPLQADGHWTGAMVERDEIGLRITWLDSMNPGQQIPEDKLEVFKKALNITLIPKANEDIVLKTQRDATSCGPWMIENLDVASAVSLANETEKAALREQYDGATEANIRQAHINKLGEIFAEKQLHNNILENIDPIKLEAFQGNEAEKKAMQDLALVIQCTSPEFQTALDNVTEISQALPGETKASLIQLKEAFTEQKEIVDQIIAKANIPGYLISLNENVKLQKHSAENTRVNSRASSIDNITKEYESPIVVQTTEFIVPADEKVPKGIFSSLVATVGGYVGGYVSKIVDYFNPNVTGVEVIERQPYYNSAAIKAAQVAQYQEDLKAPTKNLAKMISNNASPKLKEALVNFVAVAPALTSEEQVSQWNEMKNSFKENPKDGAVLDRMQNEGFDHRNIDSVATVNAYIKGYQAAKSTRSNHQYDAASTTKVIAPNIKGSSNRVLSGRY